MGLKALRGRLEPLGILEGALASFPPVSLGGKVHL